MFIWRIFHIKRSIKTNRARIRPPGSQTRRDSRSTSWKNRSSRSGAAGTPEGTVWQIRKPNTCVSGETGLTHNPAALVRGHVAVHLHALAGVSVNVDGVNATQRLAIQEVLGTVLGHGKQTTPWTEAVAPWGFGYLSLHTKNSSWMFPRRALMPADSSRQSVCWMGCKASVGGSELCVTSVTHY